MIRILQVVPSIDINAGMMSVIMNYYRRIDRDEIQFDFLCLAQAELNHDEEISALGGRTYFLGDASFGTEYQKKLKLFFEEHRGEYAAVHCHPIWAPFLVGVHAKKAGIKHIIAHSHSTRFSEKRVSAIRNRLMMPLVHKFSTDYVACAVQAAEKQFGTSKGVFILKNAIDIKSYFFDKAQRESARKELLFAENDIVIGHVGRFSPEKNHSFMLNTFAAMQRKRPELKLLFVGDGPLLAQCKQHAQELGIEESVVFAGKRQDVAKMLSAMDAFWLPSTFEGVPLSAVEAQASGLPCVLSEAITTEIDLGKCIYVSLDSSVEKWKEAFAAALQGNSERINMGKKLLGSSYDIDSQTNKLAEYYLKFSD